MHLRLLLGLGLAVLGCGGGGADGDGGDDGDSDGTGGSASDSASDSDTGSDGDGDGDGGTDGTPGCTPESGWTAITLDGAPEVGDEPGDRAGFWVADRVVMFFVTYDDQVSGAVFDPACNAWEPMSTTGMPATGSTSTMFVLGDRLALAQGPGSMALYDPVADSWSDMAEHGLAGGGYVMLDGRLFYSTTGHGIGFGGGAMYDEAANAWVPITATGAPTPRDAPFAWTGDRLVVGPGELYFESMPHVYNDGAIWDAASNAWSPMNVDGAPFDRLDSGYIHVDDRIVVWGGLGQPPNPVEDLGDGAIYDITDGTWRSMAAGGPADYSGTAWLAKPPYVVAWRGGGLEGAIYDLDADAWSDLPAPPEVVGVDTAGWLFPYRADDGDLVLIAHTRDAGARYDFDSGLWTAFEMPAPPDNVSAIEVWTGSQLVVWGGERFVAEHPCPPDSPLGCDPWVEYEPAPDGAVFTL